MDPSGSSFTLPLRDDARPEPFRINQVHSLLFGAMGFSVVISNISSSSSLPTVARTEVYTNGRYDM